MMKNIFLSRLKIRMHSYGMQVLCVEMIFYRAVFPTGIYQNAGVVRKYNYQQRIPSGMHRSVEKECAIFSPAFRQECTRY